jgi:hypothetical protein
MARVTEATGNESGPVKRWRRLAGPIFDNLRLDVVWTRYENRKIQKYKIDFKISSGAFIIYESCLKVDPAKNLIK